MLGIKAVHLGKESSLRRPNVNTINKILIHHLLHDSIDVKYENQKFEILKKNEKKTENGKNLYSKFKI